MNIFNKEKIYNHLFTNLDLKKHVCQNKEFDSCNFTSCDLSGSLFKNCVFIECEFTNCNLNVLQVTDSKFADVRFTDCNISGVDWTKAYWRGFIMVTPFSFYRCKLDSSSFYGLNMENVIMRDCHAYDIDFRESNFNSANFSNTNFTDSTFDNTKLNFADFTQAENYNININTNEIKNAKFSRLEAIRLLDYIGIELVD